jgi:ferrochelatase
VKLRQFYDHPLFVQINADAVRAALETVDPAAARVVFTAHSVPVAADRVAGPPQAGGRLYSRQLAEVSRLVAETAGVRTYDLVWQSRSGPPAVPWLEPDVLDHLDALHAAGVPGVVLSPVGFVSDHMEVLWDLDTEARERAASHGMAFARAATAGADPRFAHLVVELVRECMEHAAPRELSALGLLGYGVNGTPCTPGCCRGPVD